MMTKTLECLNLVKKTIFILAAMASLVGCSHQLPKQYEEVNDTLKIYPDYKEVIVPCNVAPLNFVVEEATEDVIVSVKNTKGETLLSGKSKGKAIFAEKEWHSFLDGNKDTDLKVDVYVEKDSQWKHYPSFNIKVVSDTIDPYVTFRWIEPSYEGIGELGIYQFDMKTGKISTIIDNRRMLYDENRGIGTGEKRCMNCHNTQTCDPKNQVVQIRTKNGGMMVKYDGEIRFVNAKVGDMVAPAVYQRIHPYLPLVVFSSNIVRQNFPTSMKPKVETFDWASDILYYDIKKNTIQYVCKSNTEMTTYPVWTNDGKWVYYCQTDSALKDDKVFVKRLKYSLKRIPFDTATYSFGEPEMVYCAAKEGRSVSKPRVSPDGRYVAMTVSDYGAYHYTHEDADILLYDTLSKSARVLKEASSDQADGYVTWSMNGRWLMVGSKREDGNYVRLYMYYFDREGNCHKPFQLPHADPTFDKKLLQCYNYPEFGRVDFSGEAPEVFKEEAKAKIVVPAYIGDIDPHRMDGLTGASIVRK